MTRGRSLAAGPLVDLELLLRSRYGLIVLETPEEDRAGSLLAHLADRLDLPLFTWTRTKGLCRAGKESGVYGTVDLPDRETRREIFRIHLERRHRDPADFDLDALAATTDGFSGSEIEQVVVSGLYTAFSEDGSLTTETLLEEAAATRPLSETMVEKVASLRAWAAGRTVRAH